VVAVLVVEVEIRIGTAVVDQALRMRLLDNMSLLVAVLGTEVAE